MSRILEASLAAGLDFERDGAAVIDTQFDFADIFQLQEEFSALDFKAGARPFSLSKTVLGLLSEQGPFGQALEKLDLSGARPVRILAFDKTPNCNWNLGWLQNRVIAVKKKLDVPGFVNWTIKGGTHHTQPPNRIHAATLHLAFSP